MGDCNDHGLAIRVADDESALFFPGDLAWTSGFDETNDRA